MGDSTGPVPAPLEAGALGAALVLRRVERAKAKLRVGGGKSRTRPGSSLVLDEAQREVWAFVGDDLMEDPIRCDVCNHYDTTPDDAILLCDGCDVAVHQSCYQVKVVPEGEWLCEYCAAKREADALVRQIQNLAADSRLSPQEREATAMAYMDGSDVEVPALPRCCVLCPRSSGALIRTSEGLWCHLSCALWAPECWVENCRTVFGVAAVPAYRFESACGICGLRGFCAVNCRFENCREVFHPQCASMAGFGMNITGQINISRGDGDVTFHAFCLKHRLCAHSRGSLFVPPLEFNQHHPDFGSALYQSAMLVRRNRDILLYADICQKEKSLWASRVASYLIKELFFNLKALKHTWKKMQLQQQRHARRKEETSTETATPAP